MKASDRVLRISSKLNEVESNYEVLLGWLPSWAQGARARASAALCDTKGVSIIQLSIDVISLCDALAAARRDRGTC